MPRMSVFNSPLLLGFEHFEQMLDRSFLAQVPGITPEQQEQAMTAAAPALARLVGEGARPVLDRLASSDPSLKVRQAAHAARERLESSTIPSPPEPLSSPAER